MSFIACHCNEEQLYHKSIISEAKFCHLSEILPSQKMIMSRPEYMSHHYCPVNNTKLSVNYNIEEFNKITLTIVFW